MMITEKLIVKSVAKNFEVRVKDIISTDRKRRLFFARCAISILLLSLGRTHTDVGSVINRDHATVTYYKQQHPLLMKQSSYYKGCFHKCLDDLTKRY